MTPRRGDNQDGRAVRPPKLVERLFGFFLPRCDRAAVLAELAELFAIREQKSGNLSADAWYWKQLWSFSGRLGFERVSRSLGISTNPRLSGPVRSGSESPHGDRPGGFRWLAESLCSLLADVKYSLRSIKRSKGLIAAAVFTLALGIGTNSIVFSIVDVLMLHPLPYEDSERLVSVYGVSEEAGLTFQGQSIPDFQDLRDQSRTMNLAAWRPVSFNLSGGVIPERVPALSVSWNFFRVLQESPALGRDFIPEEELYSGRLVAILSEGLWNRAFAADSAVLGRTLRLDDRSYTVVGVMPRDFVFAHDDAQLWIPLGIEGNEDRSDRSLAVFARLAPEATLEQASREVNQITSGLADVHRDTNAGWRAGVRSLRDSLFPAVVRQVSIILMIAVASVLLVACANVANLMLARADARTREIAVRGAMGAKRSRVVRLLLAEAVIVSVLGGLVGLLVAFGGIRGVLAVVMPEPVPGIGSVELNSRVLLFTIGVTALTTLLFGLGPALGKSRPNLVGSLKPGLKSTTDRRGDRFRMGLVVSQISFALALLISSALMIKAFVRLQSMQFGFDPEHLFSFRVTLPQSDYSDPEAIAGLQITLLERLSAIPNTQSVSGVNILPLREMDQTQYAIPGEDLPGNQPALWVSHRAVLPGYFGTMGINVLAGRTFGRGDMSDGAPVAVINEAMAERHWRNESPIGKQIVFNDRTHEIVGLVENSINQFGPQMEPMVFWPALQTPLNTMVFVMRTTGNDDDLLEVVRHEVARLDSGLPVYGALAMADIVQAAFLEVGVVVGLLSLTAVIAVLLALVGVFGVVSYSVSRRTQELGIRMALGAEKRSVLAKVLWQGLRIAGFGVIVGLVIALLLGQGMAGLLFGVSPTDPFVIGGVISVLLLTCLLATYVPAMRATRVDPMDAIRYE